MRTHDASLHNCIANHPDVIQSVGWNLDHGAMTFDHLTNDPRTFLLHTGDRDYTSEDICNSDIELPALAMIFCWSAPGTYEAHTLSDISRCKDAVGDAKTLIFEMLTEHGANMIWGRPSSSNIRACKFFEKIGATHMGEALDPQVGQVTHYGGYKEPWLREHWHSADKYFK